MHPFARRAFAFALVFPCAVSAQGFEYAPGASTYRVVQRTRNAQEMMGQKTEYETTSSQVMTLVIARAARDTLAVAVTLDSITTSNTAGIPTPNLDRLLGMTVSARVSPSGATVYSVAAPSETERPNSSALATAMGAFLPRIGARIVKGATWRDTSSGRLRQGGIDIDRKTLSRYVVVGDTTIGGERTWKIQRTDSTAMSGSGTGQGGPMTMEGTSIGAGTLLVTAKGAFIGAEGDEDSTIRFVLSANGMEVGITQTANTRVERLK